MALVTPCSLCDVEHVRRFRTLAAARQVRLASRLLVSCQVCVASRLLVFVRSAGLVDSWPLVRLPV